VSAPPKLIESIGSNNLVAWSGRVWLVPQRLGPLDVDNPEHRRRAGVQDFGTVEEARGAAPPAPPSPPGAIRCTWWERTGAYTEFVDGISSPMFRSVETGEDRSSRELPAGALYAIMREPEDKWPPLGPDGLSIACVLPDRHTWYIDSRCNNCTMPRDDAHRCWVRHGTFGERVHVDKNGATCGGGGGSIDTGKWHGHLHAGELRAC